MFLRSRGFDISAKVSVVFNKLEVRSPGSKKTVQIRIIH